MLRRLILYSLLISSDLQAGKLRSAVSNTTLAQISESSVPLQGRGWAGVVLAPALCCLCCICRCIMGNQQNRVDTNQSTSLLSEGRTRSVRHYQYRSFDQHQPSLIATRRGLKNSLDLPPLEIPEPGLVE